MRSLGLLRNMTFFFFVKKRTAILKAFKEDDFQRLSGTSLPKNAVPVSYNSFE